jgi:hypothetical protein
MEPKVVAPSSYIMAGQDYKADIFMAAYSKSIVPKVYVGTLSGVTKDKDGNYPKVKQNPIVGGGKVLEVSGGIGKFTIKATGEDDCRCFTPSSGRESGKSGCHGQRVRR